MDELGYFEDPGGQLARSRAKPYGWHGWLWTSGSTSTSQLQRPRNARARLGPRTWQFLHGGSLPARRSLHDRRDRALPSAFPPRPLPTASVSASGFASAKPLVAKQGSRALELDQLGLAQFEAELVGRSSPRRDTDKAAIVERASWVDRALTKKAGGRFAPCSVRLPKRSGSRARCAGGFLGALDS